MPLVTSCPKCACKLAVPDSAAGKKLRCPRCGEVFLPPEMPPSTAPEPSVHVTTNPPVPLPPAPVAGNVPPSAPPPLHDAEEPARRKWHRADDEPFVDDVIAKKPTRAPHIAAIVAAGIGCILAQFMLGPVLIVTFFTALVGVPLYLLTRERRRALAPATAVMAGHALWAVLGVALVALGIVNAPMVIMNEVVLFEFALFLVIAFLPIGFPVLVSVIVVTVYQVVYIGLNLFAFTSGNVAVEFKKALLLHLLLRVLALVLLYLGFFRPIEPHRSRADDDLESDEAALPRPFSKRNAIIGGIGAIWGAGIVVYLLMQGLPFRPGGLTIPETFAAVLGAAMLIVGLYYFITALAAYQAGKAAPIAVGRDVDDNRAPIQRYPVVRPSSTGLILGLTLGGLAIVGLVIVAIVWIQSSIIDVGRMVKVQINPNPAAPPVQLPPAPQPRIRPKLEPPEKTERQWVDFSSKEFGFSVSMPHSPQYTRNPANNTTRLVHRFDSKDAVATYTVTTYTPTGRSSQLFQEFRSLAQAYRMRSFAPEIPVQLGSYEGWDFSLQLEDPMSPDHTIMRRSLRCHGKEFLLAASAPRLFLAHQDILKFFKSFRPSDADTPEEKLPPVALSQQAPLRILEGAASDVISLSFADQGSHIGALTQNGESCWWQTSSGESKGIDKMDNSWRFLAGAFSSDGKLVAKSHVGTHVKVKRSGFTILDQHLPDPTWAVAFSPDSRYVAAGYGKSSIQLWELSVSPPKVAWDGRVSDQINAVTFTPDSKTLALGTKQNAVLLWSVEPQAQTGVLKATKPNAPGAGAVWALACSADGKTLAAGGNDQSVRLWNLEKREEIRMLPLAQTVRSLAFSPDGKYLAAGDDSGVVTIWNLKDDFHNAELPASASRRPADIHSVRAVAFSPDSSTLAAGWSKQVIIWEMAKIHWPDDAKKEK